MRLVTALLVAFLVPAAHAARVEVHLPTGGAALRVWDATPPPEGLRIDCPPLCVHTSPGNSVDIFDLRVEPLLDPRINDRPWDIVGMQGCRGTSALPADTGKCFLPYEGDVDVRIDLRYRPILAVTYTGSYGAPLVFSIGGGPGTNYQGSGSSFACYPANNPQLGSCAAHLSADQPVRMIAPSTVRATLLAVSPPCGSADCEFTLTGDTCIRYEYKNGDPGFFQTVTLTGPECPTGPGVTGGGGGGGGGPNPPTPIPDALQKLKDYALEQIRIQFAQVLYPCFVASTGVALFGTVTTGPAIPLIVGGTLIAAGTPGCASGVKRLHDLQLIYNDPPNFDFNEITPIAPTARPSLALPSCTDFAGDDRRLCKRLGKATVRHAVKDERATAVAEALRITVEKASAAFEADEEGALKRQLKVAAKRQKQLDSALAGRGKAGAKLASVLGGVVTVSLTEAQFTGATTVVLGKLAELGLAETEARTLLGPALTPRSLDVLVVFGQP